MDPQPGLRLSSLTVTFAPRPGLPALTALSGLDLVCDAGSVTAVTPEPLPEMKLRDAADWTRIVEAMEKVAHVPGGTAWMAMHDAAYRVAAKTGTVQVAAMSQDEDVATKQSTLPEHLRDHALFIAFAPADAPKIALAVLVEHAGGGGGAIAAPIARKVMDAWLLPQLQPRPPATQTAGPP